MQTNVNAIINIHHSFLFNTKHNTSTTPLIPTKPSAPTKVHLTF